ncbi:hypothetical protein KQI88_01785 [Alkaliphilus sp. MSJ-5]|uniref:7-cyano-7-deazaguanine synthase (Queuosine biosynthesis) n=1 Tax=Alkaliphilus flagellatus TaxID=2841507 RepID=A0ABS6FZ33_9FIRM|nr:DUF6395 domain-containing protein [Alkaliphilus flagellatus]MBU5675146.1 hypothetical protein [Alkaliphilus flagellatus]
MKVEYKCKKGILKFYFRLHEDDRITYQNATMTRQTCTVRLPIDWNIDSIHPDVLALVTILIIYPFTGSKIILPIGVSKTFHDKFKECTNKKILPVNHSLQARSIPQNGFPALSYSGGVDSTAALVLLPSETKLFYLDRIIPDGVSTKTLYKKEAAHFACKILRESGRSVYQIETDLEYIRTRVGFPVDVAAAIPVLLLSDYIGLDSVAFGTPIETAYKISNPVFEDYAQRLHFLRWGKLFEIVGVPFNQVVAGISEIATLKIVMDSPYYDIAESCVRGEVGKPCMNCFKCFRKKLIELTIKNKDIDDDFLSKLFKIPSAELYLSQFPAYFECLFAYIASKYKGNHQLMNLLKKKTRGDILDLSWFEKWYSPSIELVPPKYQSFVKNQISKYLETMTAFDENNMKSLSAYDVINSKELKEYSDEFAKAIRVFNMV